MEQLKFNGFLGESLYINCLPSGLTCIILPKKDHIQKYAILCTNFGSVDTSFLLNGRKCKPPMGVAHFLEHKMFSDGAFSRFATLGASVNAFTSYTTTAYYFSCSENFYESLRLLMGFLDMPHITPAGLEKERAIISQEIKMYEDNPFWCAHQGLQSAMYHHHPVRDSITGTLESISNISLGDLEDSFKAFYHPSNMLLVCVGCFSRDEVYKIAQKASSGRLSPSGGALPQPDEPANVVCRTNTQAIGISQPMFSLGFKERPWLEPGDTPKAQAMRIAASKILLDILAGQSSELRKALYANALVDNPLSLEYILGRGFGQAIIFGTAAKGTPEDIRGYILAAIEHMHSNGIEEQRFAQIQRKHLGRMLRIFDNLESMATLSVDLFQKKLDIFHIAEAFASLTPQYLNVRLKELLHSEHALSIVN